MTAKSLLLIPEGNGGRGGVWLKVLALFPHICQPLWLSFALSSGHSGGSSCLPPGNLCPSHPPTGGGGHPPPCGGSCYSQAVAQFSYHPHSSPDPLASPCTGVDCGMVTPAGSSLENTCHSLAGTQLNSTLSPDFLSSSIVPS
jgi:hypothetical protein